MRHPNSIERRDRLRHTIPMTPQVLFLPSLFTVLGFAAEMHSYVLPAKEILTFMILGLKGDECIVS